MTDGFTELVDGEFIAQEGAQVAKWGVRLFQLVSLLEMLKIQGRDLLNPSLELKS